jgi:hypothetical protein
MKEASSEARNSAACATSQAVPWRLPRRVRPPVSLRGPSVGLDVHALSVVAHAVDEVTGEVSRARLCPDHGEIFCGLSLVRAPVRVV